jgi:hypothetical protein
MVEAGSVRTIGFLSSADLNLAGVGLDEVRVEPWTSSFVGDATGARDATAGKGRRFRLPWKKSTIVIAAAVATTALAAPGPAVAADFTPSALTPIHHFSGGAQQETPAAIVMTTDDVVTDEQIQALDALLALPLGPEEDIKIDDWA